MKKITFSFKSLLVACGLLIGSANAWADGVDIWDFSSTSTWGNETGGGKSANYKELATGSEVWFAPDGSSATSETSNVSFKFAANGAKFNYGGSYKLGISSTGNYDSANDINYVKVIVPNGYRVMVDLSVGSPGRPMHANLDGTVMDYTSNSTYDYTNSTGSAQTLKIYGTNGSDNNWSNHHIDRIVLVDPATAPKNSWTAYAKANIGGNLTTIKTYSSTSNVMQTEKYSVTVDKVIAYNGSYYVLNDAAFATNVYGVTYTMGATAAEHTYNYDKIDNYAFYGEAESICTDQSNGRTSPNATALSNGSGKYAQAESGYVTLTFNVPNAGIYDIKVGMNNTNGKERGFTYQIDDGTTSETITVSANSAYLLEIADQNLTAGDHTIKLSITYSLTPVFDYVLVTVDQAQTTSSATLEGYKTFYDATTNYQVDEHTTIYKASTASETVTLTPVGDDIIKAGNAVILKTTNTTDYTITLTATTDDGEGDFDGNALTYKAEAGPVTNAYVLGYLAGDGNGLGFYKYTIDLPAGSIYVTAAPSEDEDVKALRIVVDGEATGIAAPEVAEKVEDGVLYNTAGQVVSEDFKGIVIKNGKKYIQK